MLSKVYLVCYIFTAGTQSVLGNFYLKTKHKGVDLYNAATEAMKEYEPSAVLLSINRL